MATEKVIHSIIDTYSLLLTEMADTQAVKTDLNKYDPIERQVALMLIENTGCHLLDSGSAYGRYWQRNREIEDFRKLPLFTIETYRIDDKIMLDYSVNTFQYLTGHLALDSVIVKKIKRELKHSNTDLREYNSLDQIRIISDILSELLDTKFVSPIINTYNYENPLDQVLQYQTVDDYIILEIHNGCDVRGGYTYPRVFRLINIDEFMTDIMELVLSCNCNSNHYYYGDMKDFNERKSDDIEFKATKKIRDGYEKGYLYCKNCDTKIKYGLWDNVIEGYKYLE